MKGGNEKMRGGGREVGRGGDDSPTFGKVSLAEVEYTGQISLCVRSHSFLRN